MLAYWGGRAGSLASARRAAGLTQEELAERAGVSVRAISNIERGLIMRPHRRTLEAIAAALGLAGADTVRLITHYRPAADREPGEIFVSTVFAAPRQLPPDVSAFTGRGTAIGELDDVLAKADIRHTTAVLISALSGTAGVGKTALAVHWAHRVRDRFPDGQLYVNLCGYDPGPPINPGDVLASFLRDLGVAGTDIPPDLPERIGRFRTLVADRRMLVLLDNAHSADQVRDLLPGSPSCLVLITSRDSLSGLVARDGAHRLELDRLPLTEAVELLRRLVGCRVDDELRAAGDLAECCVRLPLALRIAAELVNRRPAATLAEVVTELEDAHHRLHLLDAGGDTRTALRTVFSWSCRHLPDNALRAFRLLGLQPGADIDDHAAAALVGGTLSGTRRILDTLHRAHLLEPTCPGRYGMHDLLRAYAVERISSVPDSVGRAALTRLFDHYAGTASAAMDVLYPHERHTRPRMPAPAAPGRRVADPAAAEAWLDNELTNLLAVARVAADDGWPGHTIHLSATVHRHLDTVGRYTEAHTLHEQAVVAARQLGDRVAEAHGLRCLGNVQFRRGRDVDALEFHQRALTLFHQVGDADGEARTLGNLGLVHGRMGSYDHAFGFYQRALVLFREVGDADGEARTLDNLGTIYRHLGRYDEASDFCQRAVAAFRRIGGTSPELRKQTGEADALNGLGIACARMGRYQEALDYQRQALAIACAIGDLRLETEAHNSLGETLRATGRVEDARGHYESAITLARQTGVRTELARALDGVAHLDAGASGLRTHGGAQ